MPVNSDLEELTNIEDIKIGDYVRSYNEKTKNVNYRKVLNAFDRTAEGIFNITFANEEELHPTWNHPFLVSRDNSITWDWVQTKDLKPSDIVKLADGSTTTVDSSEYVSGAITVYNFEVDDNHTYYVGESGVLVHNDACTKDDAGAFSDPKYLAAMAEAEKKNQEIQKLKKKLGGRSGFGNTTLTDKEKKELSNQLDEAELEYSQKLEKAKIIAGGTLLKEQLKNNPNSSPLTGPKLKRTEAGEPYIGNYPKAKNEWQKPTNKDWEEKRYIQEALDFEKDPKEYIRRKTLNLYNAFDLQLDSQCTQRDVKSRAKPSPLNNERPSAPRDVKKGGG